jgi:hypothetical protein
MPKHKADYDIDTDSLEEIAVLFIPFDAAGKFYKANALKGVLGFRGLLDDKGLPQDTGDTRSLVGGHKHSEEYYLGAEELRDQLAAIVKQECELVRNMYNPDSDYADNFDSFVKSRRPDEDPTKWSDRRREVVRRSLKGYKYYPDLIFLSENPTKADFPDLIDTGIAEMSYVKRFTLDGQTIPGIKHVNEMAIYLRKDLHERIENAMDGDSSLLLKIDPLSRATTGLVKGGKVEYMLKVTLGRKAGHSFTVAGVHLRAGLTSTNANDWARERSALQRYCDDQGIQMMIGDFNMDLQGDVHGSRGVYFGLETRDQPRFLVRELPDAAYPEYLQQFSNSAGTAHYMGYFQADAATLTLVGPSLYGQLGASGSRSFLGGGRFYSDHPSIYVRVQSKRLSQEAQDAIFKRKIVKIRRNMQIS